MTDSTVLKTQENSYQAKVMNKRRYTYEVLVAPNRLNDTTAPAALLKTFKNDENDKKMLKEFVIILI